MKRADEGMGFLLQYENVAWYENGLVRILDRRIFPIEIRYVVCATYQEVAQAIADMVTQSAGPYTAAAMGMALAAYEVRNESDTKALQVLQEASYILSHARVTTSMRMQEITAGAYSLARKALSSGHTTAELADILKGYAFNYINGNYIKYEKTGRILADLVPDGGVIMTQCFAETVLGTLFKELRRQNKQVSAICPETRPYFQGARLTASLINEMGFEVTVISDNMAGSVMSNKKIDLFTSAADVIAMDGTVVNKVGTFQLALLAHYFGIPYYVTGEPNLHHTDAKSIVIEERDPQFVLRFLDTKITEEGVKGYYPAFDITPANYVSLVITDRGSFLPDRLADYFKNE